MVCFFKRRKLNMFKYALMTMALLSSYPSHAFDLMELDRLLEQDMAKITRRPSPGKGISLSKAVQAEEKKNKKPKE